jgi:hypothetical protein
MNQSRIARSFTVSLAIVGSILIIPLIRCTSTGSGGPASSRSFAAGTTCPGSGNPANPVICFDSSGNPNQKNTQSNSHNNASAVSIQLSGPAGSHLNAGGVSGQCNNVRFLPNCSQPNNGPICKANTVTTTGTYANETCTYTASVNGVTGTDPTIETDTCCGTGTDTDGKHAHE